MHPLFTVSLHLVPLLLLGRVEKPTDLLVGALADLHHFGAPIILGKRAVLVQALHLGALGLKRFLYFCLLIGAELESLGQLFGALSRIGRAMMLTVLRCGGLIVGTVLPCSEWHGEKDEAGRDKSNHALFKHWELLNFERSSLVSVAFSACIYEWDYAPEVAPADTIRRI